MAYKLAEEDKLCGVIYPTYEGFSPIPKATCEMLESKCEQTIIVKCGESSEEDKKPESQSGSASASASESTSVSESTTQSESTSVSTTLSTSESTSVSPSESSSTENSNTPEEPKPTPEPQPEPVPTPVLTNEELDTIVSGKLSSDTHLGNYMVNQNNIITLIGEAPTEDIEAYKKEITDKVGDIPELKGYTVEVVVNKINGDNVGDKSTGAPLYTRVLKITKPNGDVYQSEPMSIGTTTETTIDLLEALPRVEDKFSKIITKDGQVVEVPEVSNEDKRAFEDKIINDLKAKLPEGTVVEAVLEGPKYEKGSEVLSGKTNYVLNVRTTLNGVVSEQTYNVPHTEEAPKEEPEAPELSEEELNKLINNLTNLGVVNIGGDTILSINIPNEVGGGQGTPITESNLPSISETYRASLEEILNRENNTSKKYKVNSYNITMLKHVGDHYYYYDDDTIFTYTTTITKPNGEVVTKEGKLHSTFIETL